MDRLRLMALDADDLAVISAQIQDAITKTEAIDFRPREKRFTVLINRFAWDAENSAARRVDGHERRQTVLSIARVLKVRTTRIRRDDPEQVLSLLALRFSETNAPSGIIELVFADGPMIHLEVECVEAQLEDLGAAWETPFKPWHP
ncbi:DUF2948 family protein [Oricola cellulosilytica]|uniref:DUF2948 family protein n=1 Tax=Oricola cellulosilytica TaxID=1429082 RepID=A0A4R0PFR5_9HYPH|nr:DUF2948 family protein [Oricola cellulosilytica]TCD15255.1 DUF2948 family protein [Oricola cellulosilytica]